SEAVDPATLVAGNIDVTYPGGPVAGQWKQEGPDSKVLKFYAAPCLPSGADVTVTAGAGVKDRAGNGISNPSEITFKTSDKHAPPRPVFYTQPPPRVSSATVTLEVNMEYPAGQAPETGIKIVVTGGAGTAESTVPEDVVNGEGETVQVYKPAVTLVEGGLNDLMVTAVDAAGNISAPLVVSVFRESGDFKVEDVRWVENTVEVDFSSVPDP
ncbi:MAG: Ig-like domain-containing protein, partial [FCB group bacterium]|nr:Ig-like domain-containing protein [FCB group bacterium]